MTESIFDPNGDNSIDFSSISLDMSQLTLDRLLYQFQTSPTLVEIADALAVMEQESYDASIATMEGRTIAGAVGDNLDVIGDIVGQSRILLNASLKQWFGPDSDGGQVGNPDASPAFAVGADLFGDLPADDAEFRKLILSKIFKNHVKVGSVGEIIQFVLLLTGHNISVKRIDMMDLEFIVPVGMSPNDVKTITGVKDDKLADRKYLSPLPASARLVSIMFRPVNAFAPDRATGRPDFASISIRVPESTINP